MSERDIIAKALADHDTKPPPKNARDAVIPFHQCRCGYIYDTSWDGDHRRHLAEVMLTALPPGAPNLAQAWAVGYESGWRKRLRINPYLFTLEPLPQGRADA